MIALTIAEIAEAVGGSLPRQTDATVVVAGTSTTDSREVVPGGIFFAKRGEATDGHLYAPQAAGNGAALLIVEHEVDLSVPQIIVPDTVEALADLARTVVARVRALGKLKVVAVTGSNGKTTTKNLLRSILSPLGPTVAPRASFNNDVGAPLTFLEVTEETRFLVAEMGASAVGEIARLIRIVRPDVGIVLKVGLAHAGEFGGIEATARAKTEMVTELLAGDTAILNADDERVAAMVARTEARPLWFGIEGGPAGSDGFTPALLAREITAAASGTHFELVLPDGTSAPVHFRVLGEHHVGNALAAAAGAWTLGAALGEIVAGIESLTRAERWRMEVLGGRDGITVINDAYNASPDSMSAALRTLKKVAPGRTIAVLGEMTELGEFAGAAHDQVGLDIVVLGIDRLVAVGPGARRMHVSAMREGTFFSDESLYVETPEEAFELVTSMAQAGDTILVKSSNAAGLRFLGDRLGESFS